MPPSASSGCFSFPSFWVLTSLPSAQCVSPPFTGGVFCLSVFLFCQIIFHYQRLSPYLFRPGAPFLRYYPLLFDSFFSVRLVHLELRIPYSLSVVPNFSVFLGILSWLLGFAFSFLCFLPILPFFSNSHFCSPVFFLPIHLSVCQTVYHYMRLSFSSLLSSRSLSLGASTAFLTVSLPGSSSSCWFFSLTVFRLRFFSPPRRIFACSCVHFAFGCFSLSFQCSGFSFLFVCTHRSRLRCFVYCFVHPSSVFRFVSYFAFF